MMLKKSPELIKTGLNQKFRDSFSLEENVCDLIQRI